MDFMFSISFEHNVLQKVQVPELYFLQDVSHRVQEKQLFLTVKFNFCAVYKYTNRAKLGLFRLENTLPWETLL